MDLIIFIAKRQLNKENLFLKSFSGEASEGSERVEKQKFEELKPALDYFTRAFPRTAPSGIWIYKAARFMQKRASFEGR